MFNPHLPVFLTRRQFPTALGTGGIKSHHRTATKRTAAGLPALDSFEIRIPALRALIRRGDKYPIKHPREDETKKQYQLHQETKPGPDDFRFPAKFAFRTIDITFKDSHISVK